MRGFGQHLRALPAGRTARRKSRVNSASAYLASSSASVVLPQPGGPHSTIECTRPDSIGGATRCRAPAGGAARPFRRACADACVRRADATHRDRRRAGRGRLRGGRRSCGPIGRDGTGDRDTIASRRRGSRGEAKTSNAAPCWRFRFADPTSRRRHAHFFHALAGAEFVVHPQPGAVATVVQRLDLRWRSTIAAEVRDTAGVDPQVAIAGLDGCDAVQLQAHGLVGEFLGEACDDVVVELPDQRCVVGDVAFVAGDAAQGNVRIGRAAEGGVIQGAETEPDPALVAIDPDAAHTTDCAVADARGLDVDLVQHRSTPVARRIARQVRRPGRRPPRHPWFRCQCQ